MNFYRLVKYDSNRKTARSWRSSNSAKRRYYSDRHFARMAKRYK